METLSSPGKNIIPARSFNIPFSIIPSSDLNACPLISYVPAFLQCAVIFAQHFRSKVPRNIYSFAATQLRAANCLNNPLAIIFCIRLKTASFLCTPKRTGCRFIFVAASLLASVYSVSSGIDTACRQCQFTEASCLYPGLKLN